MKPTGVGAVVVCVTVERGEMLRQRHAEEISAAANFTRALGTVRASRSWTGPEAGASTERFSASLNAKVVVVVVTVTTTDWVLCQCCLVLHRLSFVRRYELQNAVAGPPSTSKAPKTPVTALQFTARGASVAPAARAEQEAGGIWGAQLTSAAATERSESRNVLSSMMVK